MVDKMGIEWIEVMWNFVMGCFKVFVGCKNCYVEWDWI